MSLKKSKFVIGKNFQTGALCEMDLNSFIEEVKKPFKNSEPPPKGLDFYRESDNMAIGIFKGSDVIYLAFGESSSLSIPLRCVVESLFSSEEI